MLDSVGGSMNGAFFVDCSVAGQLDCAVPWLIGRGVIVSVVYLAGGSLNLGTGTSVLVA